MNHEKWNLKISDLFVIFVWLSLVQSTISQSLNKASHPYCFLYAGLSFCSIVLLGFKLKLRTGTTSSWLLTGSLSMFSSLIFLVIHRWTSPSISLSFFTFISFNATSISAVLIFFRLLGGSAGNRENGNLNAGQLLEYLAHSSCSGIYLVCFVGLVIAKKVTPDWLTLVLMASMFLTIGILTLVFIWVERKFQN